VQAFAEIAAGVASLPYLKVTPSKRTRRAMPKEDLLALVSAYQADLSPLGARDAAMLLLAASSGLRGSELTGLDLAGLEPAGDQKAMITLRKSRGGLRRVEVGETVYDTLAAWLVIRGSEPGPLFCVVTKAGKIQLRYLSNATPRQIPKKHLAQAGLKPITWADLSL
jgi:site-specific recombinase XerC